MARRPTRPTAVPDRPILTTVEKNQAIRRLNRRIEELEAFDPNTVMRRFSDPNAKALETAIDEALSTAFGHGTVEYERYRWATQLDHGSISMRVDPMFGGGRHSGDEASEAREHITKGKQEALSLLKQAVKSLREEVEDDEADAPQTTSEAKSVISRDLSKVFLVHGHDEGAREAVARFLERLDIKPIILHEQTNQGRTVIEKIEAHGEVGFAVILLTPDDEGCVKGGQPVPRARQNVLLELGYFIGRLGRGYVCALKRGDVEIPSDFAGVVYEAFDNAGAWKTALGRELQGAGFQIDWNAVMRL